MFFNARFYYPIFTILFLDFGLSISQFAILNAVWAMTIVIAEVPSGAFADIFGRVKLLIFTSVLMVMEMAVLCLAPQGSPTLLFSLFMINRILSGIAEAAASGADEALAYDSLKQEGDPEDWGKVLEIQMRFQSIAFIVAMTLGAAVYDPLMMQKVMDMLGVDILLNQDITLRFPLYLTLLMSILTLLTTIQMKDSTDIASSTPHPTSTREAFSHTFTAGKWIFNTPFAFTVILFGLLFDGIIRLVITLSSQYYRMIHLPEASFGLIGAATAGMGMFIPRIARRLTQHHTPKFNFAVVTVITLTGLLGMSFFLPYTGLAPALILFSGMFMTAFFVSYYLNDMADSRTRATVLSFKGLSFNLSYGIFGILYGGLLHALRYRFPDDMLYQGIQVEENRIFMNSFPWLPLVFMFLAALIWISSARHLSGRGNNNDIRTEKTQI